MTATVLATATALCVLGTPGPDASIRADLDGDGRPDTVEAYLAPAGDRGFLRVTRGAADGEPPPAPWTSPLYPAWSAHAGRLDRSGRALVVLGTWTPRPRHGQPGRHRAAWVLGWEAGALHERWRGTALARPLEDLAVADLDGDGLDELLALERDGARCWLAAYRWRGFGFAGVARRGVPCGAALAPGRPGRARVAGAARTVRLEGGRLALADEGEGR